MLARKKIVLCQLFFCSKQKHSSTNKQNPIAVFQIEPYICTIIDNFFGTLKSKGYV